MEEFGWMNLGMVLGAVMMVGVAVNEMPFDGQGWWLEKEAVPVSTKFESVPVTPTDPASEMSHHVPKVQVALLLDNSGSMGGLLERTKAEVWELVNEVSRLRAGGQQPQLEVALFTHGDTPVRKLQDFTTDLDLLSEKLFALNIAGGSEYCGEAIQTATRELEWGGEADLKLIFVAGNEEFTQGPVDYRHAISSAAEEQIAVGSIYCGDNVETGWKEAASLGRGGFALLAHNEAFKQITTPFDDEIMRLGRDINETYIAYGAYGVQGQKRQLSEDSNALGIGSRTTRGRMFAKSKKSYRNDSWDLVDAIKGGKRLSKVATSALPPIMRSMTEQERVAHVESMKSKRAVIQTRLRELEIKQRAYRTEHQEDETPGLAASMIKSIVERASAKGFSLAE